MRPRGLAALGAAVLMVACGGAGKSALDETASNLNDIDSAVLALDVTASAGGEASVAFALRGPFSFESDGPLPVAELDLTERRGSDEQERTLISDGKAGYLIVDGVAYQLPDELVSPLRLGDGGDGGLAGIDLAEWVEESKTTEGSDGTEVISGKADAVVALNDLLPLMGGVGGVEQIEGDAADRLARAVQESRVEIMTGKDDRILRRLELSIRFGAKSKAARRVIGELGAPQLDLVLELDRVNEEVRVVAPKKVRPYAELG